MTTTLVPSSADVLAILGETVDRIILPAMNTQAQRSAATTLRQLLRYVSHRLDAEGQLLFDEQHKLHGLLADAASYLEIGAAGDHAALACAIRATLGARRGPEVYLSVALLSGDIAALRKHVSDVLLVLQATGKDPAGVALRAELRGYITWQIEQEAKIVEPAFRGHGLRR